MSAPRHGWIARPRYHWGFVDYALFAIPAAAVALAGLGVLLGWR